jgi:hypothetical protein
MAPWMSQTRRESNSSSSDRHLILDDAVDHDQRVEPPTSTERRISLLNSFKQSEVPFSSR